MFIRLFLIVCLIPLQSCSNTVIGEKLESSFDTPQNPRASGDINIKSKIKSKKQNEATIFEPTSPYAISKLYAHWMVSLYR